METSDLHGDLQAYFIEKEYHKPQDIIIDYQEIKKYPSIVTNIKNNYDTFCDDCLRNLRTLATAVNDEKGGEDIYPYSIEIINYDEKPTLIKDIRGNDNNRLINVECVVKKVYEVKMELYKVGLICPECKNKSALIKTYRGKPVFSKEDMVCPICSKKRVIDTSMCIYKDIQRISVQEARTDYGKQPKSIDVYLYGNMCDKLSAGNRCTITGQLVSDLDTKDYTAMFYMDCTHFEKAVDDYTEVEVTDEDKIRIKMLAAKNNIYDLLKDSINPMIYGYDSVKLALVLQMFGGVGVNYEDGSHQRGDSHILLVGDPSMAKSQLIRSVSAIVPRGVYASGRSTSGAGLTAAAIKDTTDEKWYLEAGAMVLASGGMCIIDELDKMRDEDRSALHEAMESQTISVNKAGLSEKLITECSVLAAANPKDSRFNPDEDTLPQINLPASLISRFDLVFMLKDVPDAEVDKTVAGHVLSMRSSSASGEVHRPISIDMMRKYITYAKTINPELTPETKKYLQDTFSDLRKRKDGYITIRQLEALVRLCESAARVRLRTQTSLDDARMVVELFKTALKELTLSETIDVSKLFGAPTKKQESIESHIKKYLEEGPLGKLTLIQTIVSHTNYSSDEVEDTIKFLLGAGKIYDNNNRLIWSKN